MKQSIVIISGGNGADLKLWAEHLGGLEIKRVDKQHIKISFDDPEKLFWLGVNINSGLKPPQNQTRQSNHEFLRNEFGSNFPVDPKCPA